MPVRKLNPIRTDKELKFLFEKMVEYKTRFEIAGIEYYLGGSCLLGLYRSGGLLPYASGATFHFKDSELKKVRKEFKEVSFFGKPGNKKGKIVINDFVFEFVPWTLEGEYYKRQKYKIPKSLLTPGYFITFKFYDFQVFNTPLKYIEWRYGKDWKTPINSNVRSEYKENQCYYNKG